MNRIRKYDGVWQVLITPNIKIFPDSPILVGNWEDENLRNYHVLTFESLNDAQAEAFKYPDIDWHRLVVNHQHIFQRLDKELRALVDEFGFNAEIRSTMMDSETFKNTMFDRVMQGGERFNMRYGFSDIIGFTIVNPWTNVLHKIARAVETAREHLHRDDFRIRGKKIVDGKTVVLIGYTEFGTTYEIKLIPSLLDQWSSWFNKNGYRNEESSLNMYKKLLETQSSVDSGIVLV